MVEADLGQIRCLELEASLPLESTAVHSRCRLDPVPSWLEQQNQRLDREVDSQDHQAD